MLTHLISLPWTIVLACLGAALICPAVAGLMTRRLCSPRKPVLEFANGVWGPEQARMFRDAFNSVPRVCDSTWERKPVVFDDGPCDLDLERDAREYHAEERRLRRNELARRRYAKSKMARKRHAKPEKGGRKKPCEPSSSTSKAARRKK